jgi:DNA-binding PadR family transcriptional regulator
MGFLKPQTIEEHIVHHLSLGEETSTELLKYLEKTIKHITKQGFYKALRKLQRDEVVVIYKKTVSLDRIWVRKIVTMLEPLLNTNIENQNSVHELHLEDKESATYTFTNIKNLDTFWGYLQNTFVHKTDPSEPIFSYDPHYWFYIARKDREKELLKDLMAHKRQFLMTAGGTSPLDKLIKNDFDGDYLQYNYKKMFVKPNYYVTLMGDYVIEVTLDTEISEKIEKIYQESHELTDQIINTLKEFLMVRNKNKIKISKNKKKAAVLRKKMQKDFYVIRKTN